MGTLLQIAKEKKKSVTLTDSVAKKFLARNRFRNPADRETTTIAEAHDGMASKNRPHSQPKRVNVPSSQHPPSKTHIPFSVAGSDGDLDPATAATATALPTVAVVPASGTLSFKWNGTKPTVSTQKTSFPTPQMAKKRPIRDVRRQCRTGFRGSCEPCYCFRLLALVICYSFSLVMGGTAQEINHMLIQPDEANNFLHSEHKGGRRRLALWGSGNRCKFISFFRHLDRDHSSFPCSFVYVFFLVFLPSPSHPHLFHLHQTPEAAAAKKKPVKLGTAKSAGSASMMV